MASKFLNLSTDTTLGGNAPSDEIVSSQKALKAYVDGVAANIPTVVSSVSPSSTNADAVGAKLFYDTCGDIESLINAL